MAYPILPASRRQEWEESDQLVLHSKVIVSKTDRNPTPDDIIRFACWKGNACLQARNDRIWRKSPMELETNLGKDWHDKKVEKCVNALYREECKTFKSLKALCFS